MRDFLLMLQNGRGAAAFTCAALLATGLFPTRARSDEQTIKPFQLIDHALTRWRGRPRPSQLSYVVDFTGRNKDRLFRRRFRVEDSVADHATHVTMLTSEGPAPPFVQPEKQSLLPTETFGFVPADATSPAAVSQETS